MYVYIYIYHSSVPWRIEGTMTFENVPTSGQANFIFGSNGYSPLYLALGQKETSSAWE